MADMIISCPACNQAMTVDDAYAGQQVVCPSCQKEVTVPGKAASAAGAKPGASLVPEVPTTTKLSKAAHTPAPSGLGKTQATAAMRQAATERKKKSPAMTYVITGVVVAVLAAGGYFGYKEYKKREDAKKQAAEAEAKAKADAEAAEKKEKAEAAAKKRAENRVVPAVWTLDVEKAKIPESKVNGKISGNDFVAETTTFQATPATQLLRFSQGGPLSPDREILVYLHLKGGNYAGQELEISSTMRGTGVPQVVKRWKPNPKYAAQQKSYSSGYAMKLSFGQGTNELTRGKIFLALPDPEQTIIAGVFQTAAPVTDPNAAAAAAAAATQDAPPPRGVPVPGGSMRIPSPAERQQRYGIQ